MSLHSIQFTAKPLTGDFKEISWRLGRIFLFYALVAAAAAISVLMAYTLYGLYLIFPWLLIFRLLVLSVGAVSGFYLFTYKLEAGITELANREKPIIPYLLPRVLPAFAVVMMLILQADYVDAVAAPSWFLDPIEFLGWGWLLGLLAGLVRGYRAYVSAQKEKIRLK